MAEPLPVGKLPPDLMRRVLAHAPCDDPRVVVGPGVGLDCAVVDPGGGSLLVYKSDPITFAAEAIGEYLVRINTNDIATTGAVPRWLLITLLLPEGRTTAEGAEALLEGIYAACREAGIAVLGGHSEVTHGLDRPIAVGTLVGEVDREGLVQPSGARPGNRILVTKGVPIETTAILANEFPERLRGVLSAAELEEARDYLAEPGLDVLRDAQTALGAGRVTAMHDPTEGGLVTALWELAEASGRALEVELNRVPVPPLAARVCGAFGIDPLAAIASGALLLAVEAEDVPAVTAALAESGIPAADIGRVAEGPWGVRGPDGRTLPQPERDEIGRVYEA